MTQEQNSLSRREFLQRLAFGTSGAVLAALAGKQGWVSALAPDDPEDDPRSIDNATELGVSAIAKEPDTATTLSDGTVVDASLRPAWQEGVQIAIREAEQEGQFYAWTVDTNPVWLWAGVEADDLPHNGIRWSQPEITAYGDVPSAGINYEGLARVSGSLTLVKTVNDIPYGQAIPDPILAGLENQRGRGALIKDGLLLEMTEPAATEFRLPALPAAFTGFSIECWLQVSGSTEILSTSDFTLSYSQETNQFQLQWGSQTALSPTLEPTISDWHHITVIVDAGPQTISWVMDGVLDQQFGWTRFPTELHTPTGSQIVQFSPSGDVEFGIVRFYERALRTAESISSYQYYGQGMGIFDFVKLS